MTTRRTKQELARHERYDPSQPLMRYLVLVHVADNDDATIR